jgi:hypothetical protein
MKSTLILSLCAVTDSKLTAAEISLLPSCGMGGMSICPQDAKSDPFCKSASLCKWKPAGSCSCQGSVPGGARACGAGFPKCGDGGECFNCITSGDYHGCNATGTCPPPPPYTPPKDCAIIGSATNCTNLDPNAYCDSEGTAAPTTAATFNDGSGCRCDNGYDFDNQTHHCKYSPAPPPPKDCSVQGSPTNCTKLDPEAYCGVSSFPAAVFTDGSGCSCDWGYDYSPKTHHCAKSR